MESTLNNPRKTKRNKPKNSKSIAKSLISINSHKNKENQMSIEKKKPTKLEQKSKRKL